MSNRVFTQTFGVVGAILEKDGKFLLMKEADKWLDQDKWSHPAGWIDIGEDPVTAAKREVLEESGYELEPTALLGVYSLVRDDLTNQVDATPHAIKLIFKGKLLNEIPHELSDDSAATKWFTPAEIEAMDSKTLRDIDIKQMVKDYLAGQEFDLKSVSHTLQQ